MKAKNAAVTGIVGAWLSLIIAAAVGWCLNVYKIFTTSVPLAEWGVMEVMRIVGVFIAPLGAVLGYF